MTSGSARALRGTAATLAVLLLVSPARPRAHDIPADVLVQAFLRPENGRMRLLVRAPLGAMRDVTFPLRGPGYLEIGRSADTLAAAATLWLAGGLELREDGRALTPRLVATRVSLPSDRSFTSYDAALAHVLGPALPDDTELVWNQAMLDALFEYPIRSDRGAFAVRPAWARLGLRVVTALRFLPPGGAVRAFEYTGDPGLVPLDPNWFQAAARFVALGFRHILSGIDHLLFLCCLVIPFRRLGQLALVVTSFTVAHSVTLAAAAFGRAPSALWFPPLVETLIAVSILYMALENIVGVGGVRRRWIITFGFGLVHGFGFSFGLRETLQFAGAHLATSLLSFNLGVELGQLFVLALLVPALNVLFRRVVAERMGTIILSAFVAHTAWHWTLDRGNALRQFDWPVPGPALALSVVRWMLLAGVLVAAWWTGRLAVRRQRARIEGGVPDGAGAGDGANRPAVADGGSPQ